MESAVFLAEHLSEVLGVAIPTISGRHDVGSSPGLFGGASGFLGLSMRSRSGPDWIPSMSPYVRSAKWWRRSSSSSFHLIPPLRPIHR